MDKLTKTHFLLILIAISMQTYLLNGERHSEEAILFVVPITINILLFLIYITHKENSEYNDSIKTILRYSLIISAIYFVVFGYLFQLGKAFKN